MAIDSEYGEIQMQDGVTIKLIKTDDNKIQYAEGFIWLLWDDEWVQVC